MSRSIKSFNAASLLASATAVVLLAAVSCQAGWTIEENLGTGGDSRALLASGTSSGINFAPAATTLGGCALRRLTHVFSTTACPHIDGYEVRTDVRWVASATATVATVTGASGPDIFSTARDFCTGNSDCTAFNNVGEVIKGGIVGMSTTCYPGVCVYLKQTCQPIDGYRLMTHTTWVGGYKSRSTKLVSLSAAEQDCTRTSNCTAFNQLGDLIQGNVAALNWGFGKCAYLKDSALGNVCPPIYGFTEHPNAQFLGVEGEFGSAEGTYSSYTEAADICKINPKCSGWDSAGRLLIGGIGTTQPATGTCLYVKEPCPPRIGFTAYNSLTYDASSAPTSRRVDLCPADLYKACYDDPNCKAFNTMRYMWDTTFTPAADQPGMCTYIRAPGF